MLSNIVGYLYRKSSEGKKRTTEKYFKNTTKIDSSSSIYLFGNTKLVKYINRSNQVLHISKNIGPNIIQMQAMLSYYGKVWYDDKAVENIFSLTNFINKDRLTYDSHKDDDFTVQTNTVIIKFSINKKGLKRSNKFINISTNMELKTNQMQQWYQTIVKRGMKISSYKTYHPSPIWSKNTR